jgi:hypothetical protein
LGGLFSAVPPRQEDRTMQAVIASLTQFLSFDVVTLRTRLRTLRYADERATMVATTLLADAARVFVAAWIVIVIL